MLVATPARTALGLSRLALELVANAGCEGLVVRLIGLVDLEAWCRVHGDCTWPFKLAD